MNVNTERVPATIMSRPNIPYLRTTASQPPSANLPKTLTLTFTLTFTLTAVAQTHTEPRFPCPSPTPTQLLSQNGTLFRSAAVLLPPPVTMFVQYLYSTAKGTGQ
ncbi:hypothetical protein V492_05967, partial [Pseudogymnoascus sp. VKM F-4246]